MHNVSCSTKNIFKIVYYRYSNGDFKVKFETKMNDEINSGMELSSASVPPGLMSGANLDPAVPVNVQVCQCTKYCATE